MSSSTASAPIIPIPLILPVSPSQRLPLIHHALCQAGASLAELRYEGRGMLGGHTLRLQDPHNGDLWNRIDPSTQQTLDGFLWQLVLDRHPRWDHGTGSFGVVVWEVRADRIRHFHYERIVEIKTSLIEGL